MTIRPYTDAIELADDRARVVLAPTHGASVLRYDWLEPGTTTPIFRPSPDVCQTTSDFAMIPLLPWVNRIAGGGFWADGVFHPLEPNVAGERFPIHGNGFQERWSVVRRTGSAADLTLTSDGPGPYRYRADCSVGLDAGALIVTLSVTNLAAITLPFGLGFHPWIIRHPDTTLVAPATRFWTEDAQYLPTEVIPTLSEPRVDFRAARLLPPDWINTSFDGWDGEARLQSQAASLDLTIKASPPLGLYHLYSPDASAGFVCFEPVSHIPDGFNRRSADDPRPDDRLAPGETVRATCIFLPTLIPRSDL